MTRPLKYICVLLSAALPWFAAAAVLGILTFVSTLPPESCGPIPGEDAWRYVRNRVLRGTCVTLGEVSLVAIAMALPTSVLIVHFGIRSLRASVTDSRVGGS